LIVVDSSAVIAIMAREPEADRLISRLEQEPALERLISVANYVEAGTVLAGRHKAPEQAIADLDAFLSEASIALAAIDEDIARLAMRARIRHGKGFGGSGRLNFGDCFAYALAMKLNAPLLYVGDDFAVTDVQSA
jgi:ribonuclease VapC